MDKCRLVQVPWNMLEVLAETVEEMASMETSSISGMTAAHFDLTYALGAYVALELKEPAERVRQELKRIEGELERIRGRMKERQEEREKGDG